MSYKVVNCYREFNVSVIALEIPFHRFLNGQEVFLQCKQCASISISNADTFYFGKLEGIFDTACAKLSSELRWGKRKREIVNFARIFANL